MQVDFAVVVGTINDDFLPIASTIAIGTLGAVTFMLSKKGNYHFFIGVGQSVFRWCSLVLFELLVARLLLFGHVIDTPAAKSINSIVFFCSVFGIIWSVTRHGRSNKQ